MSDENINDEDSVAFMPDKFKTEKERVVQLNPEEAWKYVLNNIHIVQEPKMSKMLSLLNHYKEGFMRKPAAVRHHHTQRGGLIVHTAEVLKYALKIYNEHKENLSEITEESVYIVAILHDLSKINQYRSSSFEENRFEWNKDWNVEKDVWTITEILSRGIELNYEELLAFFQAHGGWSKIRNPVGKLATIIHCADMISSQLLGK